MTNLDLRLFKSGDLIRLRDRSCLGTVISTSAETKGLFADIGKTHYARVAWHDGHAETTERLADLEFASEPSQLDIEAAIAATKLERQNP
jgi:hypothetical protein